MVTSRISSWLVGVVVLCGVCPGLATGGEDFSFVQFSDMHLNPHLARQGPPGAVRGAEAIAWICEQAALPQEMTPFGITAPPPAFALATGDLTEYGVIDDTWEVFERTFGDLPCPLYVIPGNHDNTWVAMYEVMRQRHGGENYSFDKFGCHFACISSASPQEPVPTIDARTRGWLKADLDKLAPGTPVFVALHHPLDSNEFAPAEYDTFIDLLRDYNVVLMLYGHGHNASHREMDGIDGVMGGSTYGEKAGYSVISVEDDTLRVAYHYHHKPVKGEQQPSGPGWKKLLEKPIGHSVPERLFHIAAPRAKVGDAAVGSRFKMSLDLADGVRVEDLALTEVRIDGKPVEAQPLSSSKRPTWQVHTDELAAGRHLLAVRTETKDGRGDLRTMTILVDNNSASWWIEFDAAVKAGPVLEGDKIIVARSDGVIAAHDRHTAEERWQFETGGEILGTPAWSGELLVFGSGDGQVYALDGSGKEAWRYDAGRPVYGWPLIDGEVAYIGDNGGRLLALELRGGKSRWTFERADFAIESRPCVWGDLLVFGAWDGYLYALKCDTGELIWKVLGPKSSDGKAARYYAPADCGPVAIGDTLFVCDRGYVLATYERDGSQTRRLAEKVAAIAADPSGRFLFARTTDDRVCKFNAAGEKLWEQPVPAGRFPIPPTCHGDAVYVCSNQGLLSVLDAETGAVRWQYQATPGFYVMALVMVDEQSTCYVAGMDGSLTAVREPERP
ncbi:MAG: PQQ-binding-like beta-propeller repeat protein [Planctomycetota bacterium]